jgi:AmmeMemoRadiSam system protein B
MKDILRRPTIVDGFFYPDNPDSLSRFVKTSLSIYNNSVKVPPKLGIIAPYASYLYASQFFGAAYSQVIGEKYDTIIIISPVHKMAFPGIALSESDCFTSPLGDIFVDKEDNELLLKFNEEFIYYGEKYHLLEHSIEVQIPYITTIFGNDVKILPVILGETNTKFTIMLSKALFSLFEKKKKKYLVVVATDLSHDLKYELAVEKDKKFIDIIQKMDADYFAEQLALNQIEAYGGGGVISLLRLANMLDIKKINILKQQNSGDITDEKHKVEGYLAATI